MSLHYNKQNGEKISLNRRGHEEVLFILAGATWCMQSEKCWENSLNEIASSQLILCHTRHIIIYKVPFIIGSEFPWVILEHGHNY